MNTRISEIRKTSNLTQEQFGQKMGISKNYVNLIENGKKNPGDRLVSDICREFNVNEEWLRTGNGDVYDDPDMEFSDICFKIGVHDEKAKQAIMNYWNLSEDGRKLFWKFLENIVK